MFLLCPSGSLLTKRLSPVDILIHCSHVHVLTCILDLGIKSMTKTVLFRSTSM